MFHKCRYLAGTICLFVEIMKKVPLSKQSNKTFISSGSAVKHYSALAARRGRSRPVLRHS